MSLTSIAINQTTAAIYIRKSREDKDKPSHRLTVQREQLPAYATSQGWAYEIYDDGHASAARGKAENLKERARLEADIRGGKIDIILTIELSRLSRDDTLQDYVGWLHLCGEYNVKLATMSRILDPAQHSDWMLLLMEGGFSSVEMKVLQSRMKEGRDQAFRAGKYLGGVVPPPYIYDHANSLPIIDHDQLDKLKEIWTMIETMSTRDISKITGRPMINIRRAISDDRLNFYQAIRIDVDGNIIPCEWEPCMTSEQAERIRSSRKSRHKGYKRQTTGLLSNLGIFFCGFCGRSVRYWGPTSRRNYAYYGCRANETARLCEKSRMVKQEDIDKKIVTNLISTIVNLEDLKASWISVHNMDNTHQNLTEIDKKIIKQTTRKQRLIDAIADGIFDFSEAKAKRQEIDSIIAALNKQRSEILAIQKPEPAWDLLDITREEFDSLTYEDQRELIKISIYQVKLYSSYLTIEYNFPRSTTGDTISRIHLTTSHNQLKYRYNLR